MFRPLFREFKKGQLLMGDNPSNSLCGFQYEFSDLSTMTINHNTHSYYFLESIIVNNEVISNYDISIIDENNIKIDFNENTTGLINLLIFNENGYCGQPFINPTPTPTPSVTVTPTRTPSNLFLLISSNHCGII